MFTKVLSIKVKLLVLYLQRKQPSFNSSCSSNCALHFNAVEVKKTFSPGFPRPLGPGKKLFHSMLS